MKKLFTLLFSMLFILSCTGCSFFEKVELEEIIYRFDEINASAVIPAEIHLTSDDGKVASFKIYDDTLKKLNPSFTITKVTEENIPKLSEISEDVESVGVDTQYVTLEKEKEEKKITETITVVDFNVPDQKTVITYEISKNRGIKENEEERLDSVMKTIFDSVLFGKSPYDENNVEEVVDFDAITEKGKKKAIKKSGDENIILTGVYSLLGTSECEIGFMTTDHKAYLYKSADDSIKELDHMVEGGCGPGGAACPETRKNKNFDTAGEVNAAIQVNWDNGPWLFVYEAEEADFELFEQNAN